MKSYTKSESVPYYHLRRMNPRRRKKAEKWLAAAGFEKDLLTYGYRRSP